METMGFISVIPAILAIVLSFITRNTIVSLTIACIAGTLLAGQGIFDFPTLLQNSLGTTKLFLGYAAEYIYRHSGGLLPEDRCHPGIFPEGS